MGTLYYMNPVTGVGCPRELFLTINSGKPSDFCRLIKIIITHNIKKLGSAEFSLIEKFLHDRVL